MSNSLLEVLIWELFYANVVHTYQLSPLILLVPIEPTSDQSVQYHVLPTFTSICCL